jgi:molybdopterin-guanine dinucleotide biosynthesis protein MobB
MKKPYVLGFYGESNTGKTTLIVDLIKKLTKEGYNVATIKKTDKNIEIDSEGKDTWKHASAGAKAVVLSSYNETDFIVKKNITTLKIIDYMSNFDNYDIIIIEGASDKNIQKIRIGDIKIRQNTIMTYDDDFEKLYRTVKEKIV